MLRILFAFLNRSVVRLQHPDRSIRDAISCSSVDYGAAPPLTEYEKQGDRRGRSNVTHGRGIVSS